MPSQKPSHKRRLAILSPRPLQTLSPAWRTCALPQMGDRVRCEAVGNTEGGAYKWRITRLELDRPQQAPAPAPGPGLAATPAGMPPGAYMQQAQQLQQQAQYMAAAGRPLPHQQGAGAMGGGVMLTGPRRQASGQRLTDEQREKLAGEKYNLAPPPVAQYSSEVALAAVEMSLGGAAQQAQAPVSHPGGGGGLWGRFFLGDWDF